MFEIRFKIESEVRSKVKSKVKTKKVPDLKLEARTEWQAIDK